MCLCVLGLGLAAGEYWRFTGKNTKLLRLFLSVVCAANQGRLKITSDSSSDVLSLFIVASMPLKNGVQFFFTKSLHPIYF